MWVVSTKLLFLGFSVTKSTNPLKLKIFTIFLTIYMIARSDNLSLFIHNSAKIILQSFQI